MAEYIGRRETMEVVRCGHCKYSVPMEDGERYCQFVRDCRKPDDFCSYGERKEDI